VEGGKLAQRGKEKRRGKRASLPMKLTSSVNSVSTTLGLLAGVLLLDEGFEEAACEIEEDFS
jgi:hypothetical protein